MNQDDVLSLAWLVVLCGATIWVLFWPAYNIFELAILSVFALACVAGSQRSGQQRDRDGDQREEDQALRR
jgi:hypothetical protein